MSDQGEWVAGNRSSKKKKKIEKQAQADKNVNATHDDVRNFTSDGSTRNLTRSQLAELTRLDREKATSSASKRKPNNLYDNLLSEDGISHDRSAQAEREAAEREEKEESELLGEYKEGDERESGMEQEEVRHAQSQSHSSTFQQTTLEDTEAHMLGVIASYEERNRTERGAIRSDMDVIMKRVTTNHHNQNRRFDKLTDQFGDMMNQLSNFGNQFNVVSKQLVELTRVKPNVPL